MVFADLVAVRIDPKPFLSPKVSEDQKETKKTRSSQSISRNCLTFVILRRIIWGGGAKQRIYTQNA